MGEVLAGFGGQAADSAEAFKGLDTNLIFITLAVVIAILLFTYRSPVLWLLPIICAAFSYMVSAGVVVLCVLTMDGMYHTQRSNCNEPEQRNPPVATPRAATRR